jgi:hypothetical protein
MTRLELAANIAEVGVSVILAGLIIETRLERRSASTVRQAGLSQKYEGKSLKLNGVNWKAAPVTLVLQISSSCSFCAESLPFYRRFRLSRQSSDRRVPIIAVSADRAEEIVRYIKTQQIAADQVLHVENGHLPLPYTPTILFVDSNARVLRAFVGKLSDEAEQAILLSLKTGTIPARLTASMHK